MGERKPIEPGCNFSVTCEVPGHVTAKRSSAGGVRWSHAKPTPGQRATRREQWAQERAEADHATNAAVRAAYAEFQSTHDLHELARAVGNILGAADE
ncbi:hypothetical protein [Curtobacterium sp. MCSS17_015]|uniref:hypothetical protein n=1 Tax=Curtobacterium sp. MCSS17_015 TaxID=2175666 RepID=UPI000DAAAC35|nr:hypothetical protein [Curtobacterium sp. MCSS17_015]WIB25837.1 hypothetical protein DEJ18_12375 [Curtobacterium sp. MCSS17_015]